MSNEGTVYVCSATKEHPAGGGLMRCADHKPGWHAANQAPHRMVWPARLDACPAWRAVPTAQGNTIVYCGTSCALSHDRHEGWVGVFPVRWRGDA